MSHKKNYSRALSLPLYTYFLLQYYSLSSLSPKLSLHRLYIFSLSVVFLVVVFSSNKKNQNHGKLLIFAQFLKFHNVKIWGLSVIMLRCLNYCRMHEVVWAFFWLFPIFLILFWFYFDRSLILFWGFENFFDGFIKSSLKP